MATATHPHHERKVKAVQAPPRVKRIPDWGAAGMAGLAGGVVFMAVEMLLAPLSRLSNAWEAPRMTASIVFGDLIIGQPRAMVLALALFTHLTLSLLYARVLAMFLLKRPKRDALWVGLAFGAGLYLLNYGILGALIPRIAAARSMAWIFCHLAFGAVTALVYARTERLKEEL